MGSAAEKEWDPIGDLLDYKKKLIEHLERFNHGGDLYVLDEGQACWAPPVDIFEDEGEFVLTAELPGVEIENIKLEIDAGVVILSGEKKPGKDLPSERFFRAERPVGFFKRSFALRENVDEDRVEASMNNGILTVSIPKKPKQAKTIPVANK